MPHQIFRASSPIGISGAYGTVSFFIDLKYLGAPTAGLSALSPSFHFGGYRLYPSRSMGSFSSVFV
jgi:hypothetical protein